MRLIHKYPTEKCKTVVREVLPRAAINQDQTFPDSGRHIRPQSKRVDVREEASVEERVAKNLKPSSAILDLRRKYTVLRFAEAGIAASNIIILHSINFIKRLRLGFGVNTILTRTINSPLCSRKLKFGCSASNVHHLALAM